MEMNSIHTPKSNGYCKPAPVSLRAQRAADAIKAVTAEQFNQGAGKKAFAIDRNISPQHLRRQYQGVSKLCLEDLLEDLFNLETSAAQEVIRELAARFDAVVFPIAGHCAPGQHKQLLSAAQVLQDLSTRLHRSHAELADVDRTYLESIDPLSAGGKQLTLSEANRLLKELLEAITVLSEQYYALQNYRHALEEQP